MAAYKTGRFRTLTISGTLDLVLEWVLIKPDTYTSLPFFSMEFNPTGGGLCSLAVSATHLGGTTTLTCTAISGGVTVTNHHDFTDPTTETLAGTWAWTANVEEWVEYLESGSFPTYGGTAVDGDVPTEACAIFTERLVVGDPVTSQISITTDPGAVTVSAVATENAAAASTITTYDIAITARTICNMACTQAGTWEWQGFTVGGYTKTDGAVTASAYDKAWSLATVGTGLSDAIIWIRGAPPQGYSLLGVLRADNAPYTVASVVRVVRKAGEAYHEVIPAAGFYSDAYTQLYWGVDCVLNGVGQDADGVSEQVSTLYHWLVPPTGEAADQWRLMLRGAYYTAGTIIQAAAVALDGSFNITDAGIARTFSPEKSMAGYRYLLCATDQATKSLSLVIGNKHWTVTTDGAGLAIFDLCGPHNLSVHTDARDSRWPVPTDADTVSADGCMWGVVNVGSLTLTAESGVTFAVGSSGVYLSRDTWSTEAGHSLVAVVAPHLNYVDSGAANTYKRPLIRGDSDGRRSLEEADWTLVTGSPDVYTAETIRDILDEVNASDSGVVRNPGWTATIESDIDVADGVSGADWDHNPLNPLGDHGLLNRNRNASWIEGSGIAYYDGDWHYATDLDVSSAYTLVAQMLVDKVVVYPGIGDAFGLRTGAHQWEYYDPAVVGSGLIELRGGRHMRGAAWGLVYDSEAAPRWRARVRVRKADTGVLAGQGLTNRTGEYLTGPSYGIGGCSYKVILPPVVTETFYSRKRHRVCFVGGCDCCEEKVFMAWPAYFPFGVQAGDADVLPTEEWRRVPPFEQTKEKPPDSGPRALTARGARIQENVAHATRPAA